tara:strand:+ start:83 stop:280 length:198 start_codon:yes stop_codon:yes gene_type:complete
MDYGVPEKRRKGKDKRRDKKKHPYKIGGAMRTGKIKLDNEGTESKKKKGKGKGKSKRSGKKGKRK